jgi:hypothetical protein
VGEGSAKAGVAKKAASGRNGAISRMRAKITDFGDENLSYD